MDTTEKIKYLKELTDHFSANLSRFKSTKYDEANTRVDFIDKFFELLDWDVRNEQRFSEDYREDINPTTSILSACLPACPAQVGVPYA